MNESVVGVRLWIIYWVWTTLICSWERDSEGKEREGNGLVRREREEIEPFTVMINGSRSLSLHTP